LLEPRLPKQGGDLSGSVIVLVPQSLRQRVTREIDNEYLPAWAQNSMCFSEYLVRLGHFMQRPHADHGSGRSVSCIELPKYFSRHQHQ
jgi:hypothetical protein